MPALAHQRCFNHALREAVARCPECHQFYCRECITEHDDRVICSSCLKKLARPPITQRLPVRRIFRVAHCVFSLFLAWYFFFLMGEYLLRLPDAFHEGTLWHVNWIDKDQ